MTYVFCSEYSRSRRTYRRPISREIESRRTSQLNLLEEDKRVAENAFTDWELADIEVRHPEGLSSDSIVGLLQGKGIRLTEATLRKWVQLGLLPRSRRVGLPGGLPGSVGLYPATVVRRILNLKTMMAEYTIEEIKHHFLFVRGDVEDLERTLGRIFVRLADHVGERKDGDVEEASRLATELLERISKIEARLTHS